MQFLKTLLWVVIAAFLAVLATRNWHDVTLTLWGDIQADIKLPVLLAILFMAGFLPPFLILRARLWALRRRLEVQERERTVSVAPAEAAEAIEPAPVI